MRMTATLSRPAELAGAPRPASEASSVSELHRARKLVDDVFALVQQNCLYERPISQRHRIVFYIGHVEAFDWNLVTSHSLALEPFAPELDRLFAFGIDPGNDAVPVDRPEDWPELATVQEYCRSVRSSLDAVWPSVPEQLRLVVIEHKLMHAETLAYMLHNLPKSMLLAPSKPESSASGEVPAPETMRIPAGAVTLGQESGFGWDNEFPPMRLHVPAFAVDRYKVTNAQYLRFVEAGGEAPNFWVQRHGSWHLDRMFDEIPLPPDWPVYVTHKQATAYAEWSGKQLPTEPQWHRAAFGTAGEAEHKYPWGDEDPSRRAGNFDSRQWDPVPVTAHPSSASSFGCEQMSGNGWEWTATPFRPFPAFKPFSFYPGYSADFFDDEHFVLKGASPRTDRVFLRRSFRNWFRRDYPYTFATFRCIQNPR